MVVFVQPQQGEHLLAMLLFLVMCPLTLLLLELLRSVQVYLAGPPCLLQLILTASQLSLQRLH